MFPLLHHFFRVEAARPNKFQGAKYEILYNSPSLPKRETLCVALYRWLDTYIMAYHLAFLRRGDCCPASSSFSFTSQCKACDPICPAGSQQSQPFVSGPDFPCTMATLLLASPSKETRGQDLKRTLLHTLHGLQAIEDALETFSFAYSPHDTLLSDPEHKDILANFDAHVGDTACHMRAQMVWEIYQ